MADLQNGFLMPFESEMFVFDNDSLKDRFVELLPRSVRSLLIGRATS